MRYLLLSVIFVCTSAFAETYFVDIDPVMELNCTNPTERVDGTPLAVSEIREIRWEVYQDSQVYTVNMPGGCYLMDFDLSVLAPGKWGKVAWTIDTGGRASAMVQGKPFDYEVFVANPNAPVIIEPVR